MKSIHILILIAALLQACAKIGAPSGGAKDTSPPILLNSKPDSFELNVNTNEFTFTFDEYIQLNNPKESILINPEIKEAKFAINGKQLSVSFEQELSPFTTYSIQFIEAIKDNNEGNILPNLSLTFSTTSYLDSFGFSFISIDNLTGKPLKSAIYLDTAQNMQIDSMNFPFIYKTKSSKEGTAKILYIPRNEYKIIAYADENNNQLYDLQEPIAILIDSPKLSDTTCTNIKLSKPRIPVQSYKLLTATADSSLPYFYAVFNHPIEPAFKITTNLQPIESVFTKRPFQYHSLSEQRDTVFIFYSKSQADSITLNISIEDSLFTCKLPNRIADSTVHSIRPEIQSTTNGYIVDLHSQVPILTTNSTLIETGIDLQLDSSQLQNPFMFRMYFSVLSDSTHSVIIKPNIFKTIIPFINNRADTIILPPLSNDKNFSYFQFNPEFESDCSNPIYQLLSEKDAILYEIKNNKPLIFSNLTPKTYHIRCICDDNNNGRYDPIQLSPYQEAERVLHIDGYIDIKEGWDMENQTLLFR